MFPFPIVDIEKNLPSSHVVFPSAFSFVKAGHFESLGKLSHFPLPFESTTSLCIGELEESKRLCSAQRQETLDLPYLTLSCDYLKNRMFLQNFFS
jgi:hypothetical protein